MNKAFHLAASLLLLCSCALSTGRERTLYDQLGGKPGIESIVEKMLSNIADDLRIAPKFANADITNLQRLLTEQFCAISGGPCTYTGRDMKSAHVDLNITAAEFNALVEDLIDAMTTLRVPTSAQNQLIARLATMQRDVVQR